MGRSVFVHCGTFNDKRPKAKVFNTLSEARDFARSHDPDELNFVVMNIHLTKADLGDEAWFRVLDDTLALSPAKKEMR